MDYDVVIVGAGPAGCAAAWDLSSKNRSILLVDKSEFPRRKACAAGLTVKTLNTLRYSVKPVIKNICHDLVIGDDRGKTVRLKSEKPLCAMSVRSDFDLYCLKKTIASGAGFKIVKNIVKISEGSSWVTLHTGSGTIRTRFLIGTDGVNSRVRMLTGAFSSIEKGFAVEGIVPMLKSDMPSMAFDFNVVKNGYGWIFPKDDHVNIGLYTNSKKNRIDKEILGRYANAKLGCSMPDDIMGYPLSHGGWGYHPQSGRVLLAGDAAGFTEPLMGEGLYYAVKSGQIAASAVERALAFNEDAGSVYDAMLKPMRWDLRFIHECSRFFYKFPRVGNSFLGLWPIRNSLLKGYTRGLTLSRITKDTLCLRL